MKIGDTLVVYAPIGKALASAIVVDCDWPTHLARARGVVCETVPELVPHGEEGDAIVLRVEDIIPFRSRLTPVRPARVQPDVESSPADLVPDPGLETSPTTTFFSTANR
jgi:hypothetical protein